jgi:hypothetical protein
MAQPITDNSTHKPNSSDTQMHNEEDSEEDKKKRNREAAKLSR